MVDLSLGFPGGAASQRPLHGVRVLSGSEVPPNRRNCHLQIPRTLVLKKYILRCKISPCDLFLCPFYITPSNLSSFLVFLAFWCLLTVTLSFLCHF